MVYELGIDYLKLRSGDIIDVHNFAQRIEKNLSCLEHVVFSKDGFNYIVTGYIDHMLVNNTSISLEKGWVWFYSDKTLGPYRGIGIISEFQKKISIPGTLVGFPIKYRME